ncbi:rhombosortase [Ralstonia sp. ASV6]|uniref:rhombosortase n=1 Tax=Ralstonia sp. ASV6 TaxID=2795124 RepID=UPI0034D320F2
MADADGRHGRPGTPSFVARLSTWTHRRPDWRSHSPVHPGFLAAALLMLALQAGGATVVDALCYDRAAIINGEVWRLVSGHLVHLTWAHCLLNVGGLTALAAILPASLCAWRRCMVLATLIGLILFAALPGLQFYAGFSGINYGLAVLALLPRARREAIAAVVLAALVGRAVWQWLGGVNMDAVAWLGAPPLAAAHLAGLAVGALMLSVSMIRHRPEATGPPVNPAGRATR